VNNLQTFLQVVQCFQCLHYIYTQYSHNYLTSLLQYIQIVTVAVVIVGNCSWKLGKYSHTPRKLPTSPKQVRNKLATSLLCRLQSNPDTRRHNGLLSLLPSLRFQRHHAQRAPQPIRYAASVTSSSTHGNFRVYVCQLVTDLLRTSYGEVANLLRTCYGETGVMDFGLN